MRGISEEAREILDNPSERLAYRLAPDEIADWRAALRAAAAPHVEAEVARLGVDLRDVTIGGTPCLEVVPPGPVSGTILYCFGGGYVSGSAYEDLPIAAGLAVACGSRVIAPQYRLAPEDPYPAALEDALAVANALEPGFALVGESAGGNLALSVALAMRAAGAAMPAAMGLLSPWCDLTHSGDSLSANDGRDPILALKDVAQAAVAFAGGRALDSPEISPLFARIDAPFPPTILTTGTRDLLLSSTVQMAAVLRAVGGRVDLHVWDRMWHVFEFYDLPEARESLSQIGAFLRGAMDEAAQQVSTA